MGYPLIGFPNRADSATLSGGSWETALPASNVQDPDLGVVARSTDATAASTRIDFNLGAAYSIECIGVYLPNASLSATVRVYADNEATFTAPPYDSTALALYPTTFFPASTTYFGEDVSSSQMTQEQYDGGLRYPFIHLPASAQSYQYWRIDIDDSAGNADGYVDVGRVWISGVYRPTSIWRVNAGHGFDTISAAVRTQGGKKRAITLPKWRTARLVLPAVPTDEATIQALEVFRRVSTTEQFWFVFDEDDVALLQRRSYLATLGNLELMTIPSTLWQDVPFLIEEEL